MHGCQLSAGCAAEDGVPVGRRGIQLLCGEVMPAIKAFGAELGLRDPWEANAPVHLRYSTDIAGQKVAAE